MTSGVAAGEIHIAKSIGTNHKEDWGNINEVSRKSVFPGQFLNGSLTGSAGSGRAGGEEGGEKRRKIDGGSHNGGETCDAEPPLGAAARQRAESRVILFEFKTTKETISHMYKWHPEDEWKAPSICDFNRLHRKHYCISAERHKGAQ